MAGELRATLLTTVKGDAVKKLQKDLGGLSDSLKGIGGTVSKVAKGFAGFATAIGATKFISGSIEQAKLLEQTYRSLETVFGPLTGEMQKFAEGATKIGLSQTEAAKASIFIGGVLQQYGVSTEKAAESTQRLVSLAADLSFVYGYDVQEALLGMTALFRGEYDPIEKFGVAMKQNEIESIKAARGLDKLTGAAEMNADVLIRQELLFQRTGKSLGAFTDNSDTLAVQSEVLRATFENLQATVGQELSPVITQFFSDLIPIIEEAAPGLTKAIEVVSEVIQEAAQIFIDAFDPTSKLGESIARIDIAFQSLIKTMDAEKFNPIVIIFETLYNILDLFARAIHDVILGTENLIIEFEAMGRVVGALFNQDYEAMSKGWRVLATEAKDARDAANAGKLAFEQLYFTISRGPTDIGDTTEIWDVLGRPIPKIAKDDGKDYGDNFKKGATDPIKSFWSGLQDDIAKQSAKMRLSAMGASEGLIDAILGSGQGWQKVFDSIVKGGTKAIQSAQAIFNKTSDGIKEIEEGAKKALEALDKMRDADIERAKQLTGSGAEVESYYSAFSRMLEAGYEREIAMQVAREEYAEALARRNAELIRQQQEIRDAFNKTSAEIFQSFESAGITRQMGEYASAVATLREELVALIEENVFEGQTGLFSRDAQTKLISSLNNVADLMLVVADARDRIANDIADAQDELTGLTGEKKSLFQSIVDSIMGGVNVTQLGSSSRTIIRSLTRTLEQTRAFAQQIEQLRTMGLGESAIRQIIDAGAEVGGATAKALLKGGAEGISEVNRLYSDINAVATGIGEKTSNLMFDSGVKATQALLDGLLKQESEFVQAAEYLADAFRRSFDRAVATGQVSINAPSFESIMDAVNTQSVIGAAGFAQPTYGMGNPTNITVNINPGLVTDPVGLGREVVNAIQRYESTSGRVFVRA